MTDSATESLEIGHLDRAALDTSTTVLVVPVSGLDPWTADRCWEVARLASSNGRRVALMDLSLRDPMLHAHAPRPTDQGVTDAFLRGVSISAVAQRYRRSSLYFLGAGTKPDHPTEVWASERWDRLTSGFAAEGALLIAFVPPQALTVLRLKPDSLVLLAAPGYDLAADPSPGLHRIREEGVQIAATLTPHTPVDVPEAMTGGQAEGRPGDERPRFGVRRWGAWRPTRPAVAIGTSVAVIVAVLLAIALTRPSALPPTAPATLVGTVDPIEVNLGEGDSVFYTVQVAAFNTLDRAMALAAELDRDGLTTAVTPVRRGPHETWFRVQYGVLAHPVAADSTRRGLWADGRIERPQGTILRTPYAFGLTPWTEPDQANETARGLRAQGIPAYVVEAADGARVLFGAFEEPEQAGVAESLLTAANLESAIVPRLGIAR